MAFWAEQVQRYKDLLTALSSGVNSAVEMNGVKYTQKDVSKIHDLLKDAQREAQSEARSSGSCVTVAARMPR